MSKKYAYFPGCSAKGTCRELDMSTHVVAKLFGIELVELENPGCTGAREFRAISELLHLTANGRILALAEQLGLDLAAVCDTCLLNLMETNQRLKSDAAALEAVNKVLAQEKLSYAGGVDVKHFLWVLTEDLGVEALRASVVRPLRGLRVAPFYGCHIQRPESVFDTTSDETPALDRLIQTLGGEVVCYDGASKCCGFHVVTVEEDISVRMAGGHLSNAKTEGAQCIVTPCPLCHTVFDSFQPQMEKQRQQPFGIPVLHVAQLVGLAVGLTPEEMGLARHWVGSDDIVAHLGGASV
jgi:succinate dehydrogenase / fumarate reductase cytochrome b subunit